MSPLIYVGKGVTTFDEHEGNFDIKNDVTEKIPLRNHVMTQTKQGINIALSDGDGTKVGAKNVQRNFYSL